MKGEPPEPQTTTNNLSETERQLYWYFKTAKKVFLYQGKRRRRRNETVTFLFTCHEFRLNLMSFHCLGYSGREFMTQIKCKHLTYIIT